MCKDVYHGDGIPEDTAMGSLLLIMVNKTTPRVNVAMSEERGGAQVRLTGSLTAVLGTRSTFLFFPRFVWLP